MPSKMHRRSYCELTSNRRRRREVSAERLLPRHSFSPFYATGAKSWCTMRCSHLRRPALQTTDPPREPAWINPFHDISTKQLTSNMHIYTYIPAYGFMISRTRCILMSRGSLLGIICKLSFMYYPRLLRNK